MRLLPFIIILLLASPAAAGPVEDGLKVAERKCARCHAIDPERPWDSIGSTPSFMLMAKKPESYEQRVLTVTDRRPHIGMGLELSSDEAEQVLQYILSLQP